MNKSEYSSLSEWRKAKYNDYTSASRGGYLDEICDYYGWDRPVYRNGNGYWTKEKCLLEAKKYKSRELWRNGCRATYSSAKRKGWFDECTKHMSRVKKPPGYWTKEKCIEVARKYNTKTDWTIGCRASLSSARRYGWFDECCAHMEELKKPAGYWTKEKCIAEAKKYKAKHEWQKKSYVTYSAAYRRGWFDECTTHMSSINGDRPK